MSTTTPTMTLIRILIRIPAGKADHKANQKTDHNSDQNTDQNADQYLDQKANQKARFMQKISKTGQNQKNAYISVLSSPSPKPFGVVNPFGSRVPTMPKWFGSLTTPIPVPGHPCKKSPLKDFKSLVS